MAERKRHPEALVISYEDFASVLATLETALWKFESLSSRHSTLVIEPGGAEHWHVPQVCVPTMDDMPTSV